MLRRVLPVLLLVIASAMANAEKISGFVKGSPKGKTFVMGSRAGEFTVDASKASVRMNGKFFSIGKLTGGSQVTVEGTVKGKNVAATSVEIGSLRGAKAPVKTGVKPAAAPTVKPKPKTKAKPGDKPKAHH